MSEISHLIADASHTTQAPRILRRGLIARKSGMVIDGNIAQRLSHADHQF